MISPNSTDLRGRLETLAQKWARVEAAIKQVEVLQYRVELSAINELRYAARQLIFILPNIYDHSEGTTVNLEQIERRITVAEQYLTNADHDVTDAVIAFIGLIIDDLKKKYGMKALCKDFPAFKEVDLLKDKASQLIVASRGNAAERDANYQEIRTNIEPKLLEFYQELYKIDVFSELRAQEGHRALRIEKIKFILSALSAISIATFWFLFSYLKP